MKILGEFDDLKDFLLKQKDKDIQIVTAFATGTAELAQTIAERNRPRRVVGTINAFTNPQFIRLLEHAPSVSPAVDFRGAESVHWKRVLVSPRTVVIGSAHFTDAGLSLLRSS